MIGTHLHKAAAAMLFLLFASGCTSQAVKDLSSQAIKNNTTLVERQATISQAYIKNLQDMEAITNKVGAFLTEECERANAASLREFKAHRAATRLRIRELFYEKVSVYQLQEYPGVFETNYALMFEKAEEREQELAQLNDQLRAAPQDVELSRQVLLKQREILAIAERTSRDDLDARDRFSTDIQKFKKNFFGQVELTLNSLSAPRSVSCVDIDQQAAAIAADIADFQQVLVTEINQLENLGVAQTQALETLNANLNKAVFTRLVIDGMGDNFRGKIDGLRGKTDTAINTVSAKLDAFVNQISSASLTALSSANARLADTESMLIDSLNAGLNNISGDVSNHIIKLVADA